MNKNKMSKSWKNKKFDGIFGGTRTRTHSVHWFELFYYENSVCKKRWIGWGIGSKNVVIFQRFPTQTQFESINGIYLTRESYTEGNRLRVLEDCLDQAVAIRSSLYPDILKPTNNSHQTHFYSECTWEKNHGNWDRIKKLGEKITNTKKSQAIELEFTRKIN